MPQQTQAISSTTERDKQYTLDVLRTLFFARITNTHIDGMLTFKGQDPELVTVLEATKRQNLELERVFKSKVPTKTGTFMERQLSRDVLYDIANLTELVAAIGSQEDQAFYEEFITLVLESINSVFYSQKKRGVIHFNKYKAMFQLIADELHLDANGQNPNISYTKKGGLWTRLIQEVPSERMHPSNH